MTDYNTTPETIMDNPHNCQPHLEDAFREALAAMSENEQAELARLILNGKRIEWSLAMQKDLREYLRNAAWEQYENGR